MQKIKRRRTPAMVCFHARHQLISENGIDPQFQIGNIVGDRVGRNNFDGITAGKQIERQFSRACLRARNDSCQCHNSCRLGVYLAARLRWNSAAPKEASDCEDRPASLRRCPDAYRNWTSSSEPRLAVLLQNQSGSVQGSRQRCDLLFDPPDIPTINRLIHARNHHSCVPGVLAGGVNGMVIPGTIG